MRTQLKSNSEVAHYWANQVQSEGKWSNMFFDGNKIYSYGRHYCLASIEISEITGQRIYFVNSNSYSNSTAKHQNHVRHSIDKLKYTVIRCPFPGNQFHLGTYTLQSIVKILIEQAKQAISKQMKARENAGYFREAAYNLTTASQIAQNFAGIDMQQIIDVRQSTEYLHAEIKSRSIDTFRAERQKAKEEKQAAKDRENLAKWLNNEYNGQLYSVPVHLRLSTDRETVQTTKGANVPLSAAVDVWQRIVKGDNVIGQHIGPYVVNEVTNEDITIGCHTIGLNVIRPFIQSLGVC